ncbi:Zinc carboxypeptidase [Pirellulimonas nuda]|uniref:Zinc carboxypeptidase n=1 Tax=Pirellulimonas nuda TaxID=2528009 RepID=A0A518DJ30_9BACT|nr:M14 family zinc carboxypeptidase [Pirellulimonas nuda]QDU91485.1 Zinc carboxypeptidase [Pirellulimonas nuda]
MPSLPALLMVGASLLALPLAAAALPPLEYVANCADPEAACRALAGERVKVAEIGRTAQGQPVLALTVGGPQADSRPGVLVVAPQGDLLYQSELALRLVKRLDGVVAQDDSVTFYVIPYPSPDATQSRLGKLDAQRSTNTRPTDDDRDGAVDEDPSEDLNADGAITQMRVADPAGEYLPLPAEPRLMVKADPARGERGAYRLLSEGIDNDHDELWNEDPAGGVDLNRNFTFEYPYFTAGAGPNQVSEPESRAVADFAFDHPNIFLVVTLGPQDNLTSPWKAGSGNERIKRTPPKPDADAYEALSKKFLEGFDKKHAPSSAKLDGSFTGWAYYHYGRWTLATPGWWIDCLKASKDDQASKGPEGEDKSNGDSDADPNPDPDKEDDKGADKGPDAEEKPDAKEKTGAEEKTGENTDKKPQSSATGSKKEPEDKRLEPERFELKWLDEHDAEAFAAWTKVDHPDFPGKAVEVGGVKPYAVAPEFDSLDALADAHAKFLGEVLAMRPRLKLVDTRVEELGAGVCRITTKVLNDGLLPTVSQMGETSGKLQRLQVELTGPEGTQVLAGPLRQRVARLGAGASAEHTWLVRISDGDAARFHLKCGEPSVGFVEQDCDAATEK